MSESKLKVNDAASGAAAETSDAEASASEAQFSAGSATERETSTGNGAERVASALGAAEELGPVGYSSMLYDFYGGLLNDSQRAVMSLYHDDDLSLSEIAEELGQTRQAVHYTLRRAEKALGSFEEKLGLVEQYRKRQGLAARLAELVRCSDMTESDKAEAATIIESLSD